MKRKNKSSNNGALKVLILILFLAGIGILSRIMGGIGEPPSAAILCAENAVPISIVYMPLTVPWMPTAMERFNTAYVNGTNPVSGQPLASGEPAICITGTQISSGTAMESIVNAVIAPDSQSAERPTIFQPAVSHWFALANHLSNRDLFVPEDIHPVALSPVVIAIWQSRLEAIRRTVGYDDIGWQELLDVLNSPNGWCDYGIPNCRHTVYYGHTDPFISSTGLSTLISEFYASARTNGFTGRQLTLDQVNDPTVQDGVRDIEGLIRHYFTRTTEFKFYIAQGPDYVDFVALPENDLIFINLGQTGTELPEPLVALYPREGTFWHEHPFGILHADWVTPEQYSAAQTFTQYVLTPDVQRWLMTDFGFRPANTDVPLAYPIVEESGILPQGPAAVLDMPDVEVVAAIQNSWSLVKKQADILLLIDISGSMAEENKLGQAIAAAQAFLDGMEPNNRVGLAVFNDTVQPLVPIAEFETNETALRGSLYGLQSGGGTALYSAITTTVGEMNAQQDTGRIRAVVLLSDGADSPSSSAAPVTLNEAIQAIEASRDALNPVIVIPVAYGTNADLSALNRIALASATQIQSGDPSTIQSVLQLISSYF